MEVKQFNYFEVGDLVRVPHLQHEFVVKRISADKVATLELPLKTGGWNLFAPSDQLTMVMKGYMKPRPTKPATKLPEILSKVVSYTVRIGSVKPLEIYQLLEFLGKQTSDTKMLFQGAKLEDIKTVLDFYLASIKSDPDLTVKVSEMFGHGIIVRKT
jgi:hypothetical protein